MPGSRWRDDRAAVGDLLQRLGYVIADRGDRRKALRLAETATMIHVRLGNREAAGTAMVDQGIWLYNLDRSKEAIETLKIALESLPLVSLQNRFAALQNLGLAYQRLGDHVAALRNLEAAQQTMPSADEWARGKLLWLRSRVQADLGQLAEAADILEEVITIFRELHHGEAAIATCELVYLQLARGNYEAAYEVAIRTRSLLEPLRHNRIISAAIGDLLRSGHAGLTLALVERVMAQIENERQEKQIWRSLRIKSPGN